jgi:hypothetical protein
MPDVDTAWASSPVSVARLSDDLQHGWCGRDTTLLLPTAERDQAVVWRIAGSPSPTRISASARLMLRCELGRLAKPISEL